MSSEPNNYAIKVYSDGTVAKVDIFSPLSRIYALPSPLQDAIMKFVGNSLATNHINRWYNGRYSTTCSDKKYCTHCCCDCKYSELCREFHFCYQKGTHQLYTSYELYKMGYRSKDLDNDGLPYDDIPSSIEEAEEYGYEFEIFEPIDQSSA